MQAFTTSMTFNLKLRLLVQLDIQDFTRDGTYGYNFSKISDIVNL